MKKISAIGIALTLVICLFVLVGLSSFGSEPEIISAEAAPVSAGTKIVYLGGTPIGVSVSAEGLVVGGYADIISREGAVRPAEKCGIKVGDMLLFINGAKVQDIKDVQKAVNGMTDPVTIVFRRGTSEYTTQITPVYDVVANGMKIGLYLKKDISGVGTLTFVDPSDNRFGCLGHHIGDPDSDNAIFYQSGATYPCKIIGVVKGEKGEAGALKGVFDRNAAQTGRVDCNTVYGVFGTAQHSLCAGRPMVEVGSKAEVTMGKAYIYTTVDGTNPSKYEIEIVKAERQDDPDIRSMVIRVTDARLLSKTGGIVQGMSGSPIVQNGRLIGAVTHVFINDPTSGFGVYIDFMIDR